MFTIYLACLIFGSILIAVSIFFGGDSDADVDTDLDVETHVDIDTDIEIHTDADIDTDIDHEISHSSNISDAAQFFSFRNLLYFITFFGLTGTILDLLGISTILTLISSIGIGAFSWYFSYRLIKYFKQSASGETFDISELKGTAAKVTIPVHKNKKGKILVNFKDSSYEIPAIVSERSEDNKIPSGKKVLIIEFTEGVAYIDHFDL